MQVSIYHLRKLANNQRMHGSMLSRMRGDILSKKGQRIDRMSATCWNSPYLLPVECNMQARRNKAISCTVSAKSSWYTEWSARVPAKRNWKINVIIMLTVAAMIKCQWLQRTLSCSWSKQTTDQSAHILHIVSFLRLRLLCHRPLCARTRSHNEESDIRQK
jgi:hypothetical protein